MKWILFILIGSVLLFSGCSEVGMTDAEARARINECAELGFGYSVYGSPYQDRKRVDCDWAKKLGEPIVPAPEEPAQSAEERAADSLEYVETSQKVRDAIEAVGLGVGIFNALTE